ncbi:site-specific integrase [Brevibacillus fulvus]|uniref:Integrase n=1 Tax=Brevibacillus fulvus TaxID=1125967 RepID=A0A939BR13_9BACL|nr:site-specific integrase [Brevibacillus fulvus]MBM7589097.1 integrase [Brevibacillus fulvus]
MSNLVFEDRSMYNRELKENFLRRYPEHTWNAYKRIFYYSEPLEQMYQTDLYEFHLDQIGEIIRTMEPSSLASVKAAVSVIKSYIDWAISYRTNNLNPLDVIHADWEKKFVDTSKKLYWSYEEIQEILDNCLNAQDAVIIALLFEGASGKEVSELRNLTYKDIDFATNTVRLVNEKAAERTITVSARCLQLLKEAWQQTEYLKRNGHLSANARNIKPTSDLLQTGYIIKPANTKNVHLAQVNAHVIYSRLSIISELFDLPHFTVKNIQRSGMIYWAKVLLERDGKLQRKQLHEICEKFDVSKIDNHGYIQYNTFGLKDYINLGMIHKLYGEGSSE